MFLYNEYRNKITYPFAFNDIVIWDTDEKIQYLNWYPQTSLVCDCIIFSKAAHIPWKLIPLVCKSLLQPAFPPGKFTQKRSFSNSWDTDMCSWEWVQTPSTPEAQKRNNGMVVLFTGLVSSEDTDVPGRQYVTAPHSTALTDRGSGSIQPKCKLPLALVSTAVP